MPLYNGNIKSKLPTVGTTIFAIMSGLATEVGATSQQYLASDSGYYKVGISQTNGVIYSDSILITVFSAPQLANVSDTAVCKGTVVDLQIPNVNGNSFSWFTKAVGGTSFLVSDNYQTPPVTSSVSYFIESIGGNGCRSLGRAVLNVDPLPTPICSFTTTTTPQSGLYPTVFLNSTTNADSQVWYFGDTTIAVNVSYNLNPVYTYPSTGDFNVILISKNVNGCIDSIFKTVNIHNNNSLFIPTTFSPNGDGKNDIFRVRGDQFSFQEMKIYDQWGTLIYHTDASRPDWDGKVNGENVQNATYVYRIRILEQTNIAKELTGSITVIR